MGSVLVPYLQHCQVDIRPRTDLHFESRGQFYPPSGQSLTYYMNEFGPLDDAEEVDCSMEACEAVWPSCGTRDTGGMAMASIMHVFVNSFSHCCGALFPGLLFSSI